MRRARILNRGRSRLLRDFMTIFNQTKIRTTNFVFVPILKYYFVIRTELENHMKIQHNIAAKHKCSICDEILPSPAGN